MEAHERSMPPRSPIQIVTESASGLAERIALTLLGAAGLAASAFLVWSRPLRATAAELHVRGFADYEPTGVGAPFMRSMGIAMLAVAGMTLLGMAFRSGWLTRLAGIFGVIAFGLWVISLYRAPDVPVMRSIGEGAWTALAAGVITLAAGFMPLARRIELPAVESAPVAHPVGPPSLERERGRLLETEHEAHIVPVPGRGYDLIGPGRFRRPQTFATEEEAEARARQLLASTGGGMLVKHGRRGKVRATETVRAA